MALQSETLLAVQCLGILEDHPVDPLQPTLPDGMHLRWSFGGGRGFPWYGYYLFRRPHRGKGERLCLSRYLHGDTASTVSLPLFPAGATAYATPLGVLSSDVPLALSEDFPPPDKPEFDLRGRGFLKFACAEPAARIHYQVGLRKGGGEDEKRCVLFTRKDVGVRDNPRKKDNLVFTVLDAEGRPEKESRVDLLQNSFALNLRYGTEIDLPCAAGYVELELINGASKGELWGLNAAGEVVAKAPIKPTGDQAVTLVLEGKGMTRVVVRAPQNETWLLRICYICGARGAGDKPVVTVQFLSGDTVVHEEQVTGVPGTVVAGQFGADHLDGIRFSGGNAALVDLCVEPVRAHVRGGWKPLEKCPQPIALPVRDTDYPASGALPTNLPASEAEALGRIRYGNPADWGGARFGAVHGALRDLVNQGPAGPAMRDVADTHLPGVSADPTEVQPPHLSRLHPMNYLLLGSLHVPIAQMLGLYWVDATAKKDTSYDYLLIADHTNQGHGDAQTMLAFVNSPAPDWNLVDGWLCLDVALGNPAPLATPTGLKLYALPGTTTERPDGTLRDMSNNTGLIWDLDKSAGGKLAPDAALMYVVRRADLAAKPPGPVAASDHKPITETPHLVTDAPAPATASPPAHWPDLSFHFIDGGLGEGWYSYRINGIDLFGRYSPPSAPGPWHRWTPEPDPEPWYFDQAVGNGVVWAHAVAQLDKNPPPRPTGVEAFCLDPHDPDLIRDAGYQAWHAALTPVEQTDLVGLRVRWLWTYAHMRQAPDTAEFRIYYQDGQPNLSKGRITGTAPAGPDHTTVTTDLPNGAPAGAWTGCYLRSNGRSFKVTASAVGAPLTLTVANLAPDHSLTPDAGRPCALTVPHGHPRYLDLGPASHWDSRIWTVPFASGIEGVMPAPVPGSDAQLAGEGAVSVGNRVTLPPGTNLSGIRAMAHHLYLSEDTARPSRIYLVRAVDVGARKVTLDGNPTLTGGLSGWELGVLVRRYDVFLPATGDADRSSVPLNPSTQQPVVYAQVGVTAVDDKNHTGDDPGRAGTRWGDRHGNESDTAGPATIFRVHRAPPPAPRTAPDSDAVFASRADYQGHSFYTFRWVPEAHVDAHIFRAMDATVYARDLAIRSTRTALSGAEHQRYFPNGWNGARRAAAAAELNAIAGPGAYAGLSADARDVLGRLPGNEGYRAKGTLDARDWLIRRTRTGLSAADTAFFPTEWADALKRQNAADALNAVASAADYAGLTHDARRVLAGLPGVETAFAQRTHTPLPNVGAATANRLGPDNAAGFPVDPALRAYVDTLDGRSTNAYFYRAGFVDTAQNVGPLGLSSPPVYLPDVLPPRAPVFTRVLAGDADPGAPGDRKICLRWASNREKDLAAYHVYRTDVAEDARDLRLMARVHVLPVAAGDPAARPGEVVWVDDTVLGLVTYHYRLAAVDTSGNVSAPSAVIAARAFDTALPEVPVLNLAWVEKSGKVRAEISWTSDHTVLVQRKEGLGNWIDLAKWREPGTVTVRDPFSDPAGTYGYRALVRKYTGALKRGEAAVLEPMS